MPQNKALLFKSVPQGVPVVGRDLDVGPADYDSEARCPEHGIFVKCLYSSIDPYLRGRMRPAGVPSYLPALAPGEPFSSRAVARVLRSDDAAFGPGDLVVGMLPVQEYVAVAGEQLPAVRRLHNPLGIDDLRQFLGPLGVPGLTAYGGLYGVGRPARGQTILVSAASGAVGQVVGQMARIEGLRTIGSVGTDEKLAFITGELRFDAGFNYRAERPADALARLAPGGLDIYFDNVGGEHLEAAVAAMKDHGRIVMCGSIGDYNTAPEQCYGVRNMGLVFAKRLTLQGFVVSDLAERYGREHQERMQEWIKMGLVRTRTWETKGIENAPGAFLALFSGQNFGKAVLAYD